MSFVTDNQLPLLILFFLLGLIGTAFLFRKPAGHRAWKLADLVWVVLGGIGALVAVLAAYKDFSAPLRELFRHYQGAQDVFVRYEDLLRHLAPEEAPTAGVGRG